MPLNRSFVYLMFPNTHGNGIDDVNDYLSYPAAAAKVVDALKEMGVKYFLVDTGNWDKLEDYLIIGEAIREARLQFFSSERWSFEHAIDDAGHFDSTLYINHRVEPILKPLRDRFGATFAGFHFKDEPGLAHLDNLGEMKAYLNNQPEFQGMKVFLNLLPIHANYAALSGLASSLADSLPPSEYGVDCSTNSINLSRITPMYSGYVTYARIAAEKINPDFLCFDLYPFVNELINCTEAVELIMSWNLDIVSATGRFFGITPAAYLQNKQFDNNFYPNFHHLRWFASWALAFGIRDFANFISHSNTAMGDNGPNGPPFTGLLDDQNNETKLGVDQRSVFGFIRYIQYELATFSYNRFVASFLAAPEGDIVKPSLSTDVIAGEYYLGDFNLIFCARRSIEGIVQTKVVLNAYYQIEQLDIVTGQWIMVAESLYYIPLTLDEFPGALYRLTSSIT